MTTSIFIRKTSLVFRKNQLLRVLAPIVTKSPELIKVFFLAPKKRLKEALFGV